MAEHPQQSMLRKIAQKTGIMEHPGFMSFQDVQMPKEIVDFFGGPEEARKSPAFTATVHAMHAAVVVHKAGDPVFELSPDIVQALRDTDVPDAPSEDLRLPFQGINVDFPAGTLGGRVNSVSRFMILHAPGDRFRVVYHQDNYTTYFNLRPKEGKTIYECVDDAVANQWSSMEDRETLRAFQEQNKNIPEKYWETDMFRLALNTVLYITSPDADLVQDKTREHALHAKLQGLKGSRKRDVLLDKLARAKQTKRYIVGAKFRLSQEYQADLTDTGRKWVLDHRVRVMGHFKMQPCGVGLTERKRIWIAPYMKGMTFAEMVEKGYVVR